MGTGLTYEQGKRAAWRGFFLLLVVTLVEVVLALVGKGIIIEGFTINIWILRVLMIVVSLYKAYYIVKEFMHMGYEVRSLALSVLLPTLLLVWAVIAFLMEGNYWNNSRNYIKDQNNAKVGYIEMDYKHPIKNAEEIPNEIQFLG